jgi:hypothetical protein
MKILASGIGGSPIAGLIAAARRPMTSFRSAIMKTRSTTTAAGQVLNAIKIT